MTITIIIMMNDTNNYTDDEDAPAPASWLPGDRGLVV